MKIYKLSINKVADDPPHGIISSFRAERTLKSEEFYLSEEKARAKAKEIYEGVAKLAGFIPNIEAIVTSIEVID